MTSLFTASAPKPQEPAAPLPPPTMPDTQSPEVLAAARKAAQENMARAGRSSTILSRAMKTGEGGGSAAGVPQSYSGTKTGAAA